MADLAKLGDFASTLLNAATTAHFMHLQTKSYAQHMALAGLYEGLPDLVDGVVEQCQGKYGLVENYPSQEAAGDADPVEFVQWLSSYVKEARVSLPQDSEVQNDVDSIASLIDSTLYKLRFLS
jgi:hypothetical protein